MDRLESLGVEFHQDFPDVVVMTRRGEIVSPLALQLMKRWQRQRLEGPQKNLNIALENVLRLLQSVIGHEAILINETPSKPNGPSGAKESV